MSLKQKLLDFAQEQNIDLIGFAPRQRFEGLEASKNPFSIFPEGKTVILAGKRICRGSLRGVEEGSNFFDYALFGNSWLNDEFMAIACYDLTRVLENEGWEAVPVYPNPAEMGGTGVSVADGRPAPNVTPDFAYAAVACGLGEIGYSGLVLTPRFGSRQVFQMVITDAEIEPDPLCAQTVCDQCGRCVQACPLGALSATQFDEVEICGKRMKVAKVDYSLCSRCENGCVANRLQKNAPPDRVAALCNRECLIHLEDLGLVGNHFHNAFRTSKPWAKDVLGRNVDVKV